MPNSMNSFMSDIVGPTSATTIAAVAAATAILGWMATKSKSEKEEANKRRWSCFSESLAHGTFPPTSKFDEAIINLVMIFDDNDRPSVDEIVDRCVKSLLEYERFSSIFDRKYSTVSFCDKLDPYDLVRVVHTQTNCFSDEDLLKVMEEQACAPLSQAPRGLILPWWEFVMLENTNKSKDKEGKSAVIWRIHHSLGDGISLVKVVQEIFMNAKTGQPLSSDSSAGNPNLSKKFQFRRSPTEWIFQSITALASVIPLSIGKFDDLTTFRGNPKCFIFPTKQAIIPFVPAPLDFVKRLSTAASSSSDDKKKVTINDILLTVISQAIHDYSKEENDPSLESKGRQLSCRTLLPIALPRPHTDDKSKALRNLWCFISCDLSVGINDIIERLWKIHDSLAELKKGLIPVVSSLLSTFVMKLPRSISRNQTQELFARHSMVLSNVPGPPEPVSFANHEIHSVHMIHMNIIPQLSFLSYRGTLFGNAIVGIEDDEEDTIMRRRRERLPLHVSNALVILASKLQVTDVPESILDHTSQLSASK